MVAAAYSTLAFTDGGYSPEVLASATIVVWVAAAAAAIARGASRPVISRATLMAGGCLACLAALTVLSMVWADDAGRAFLAAVRVAGYLGLFVLVAMTAPRIGARAWLNGLAVGVAIVCGASLATRFAPSLFGGADRSLGALLPSAVGRLSFPIGYWNGLAACLALGAVLFAWLSAHARTPRGRAAAAAALPPAVLALYLTGSRGGFAAAVAGVLVLLAASRARPALLASIALGAAGGVLLIAAAKTQGDFLLGTTTPSARSQGAEMAAATLLCALAVAVSRYLLDDALGRLRLPPLRWRVAAPVLIVTGLLLVLASDPAAHIREFQRPVDVREWNAPPGDHALSSLGGGGRYQFWEAATDAFASRPGTGIGAGNYELYWSAHPEAAYPIVNAHSLYLEMLAELGIAGLALVVAFLVAPVLAARGRIRAGDGGEAGAALAIVAAGSLAAGIDWTWQLPAAFGPVVVAVGLLAAGRTPAAAGERADRMRQRPRLLALIATAGLAWASLWAAGVLLVGSLELDSSRASARGGDLAAAADDARAAADLQPWSPEPRLQLALVEELRERLGPARAAAGQAVSRATDDWRTWAVAARIDARRGRWAASSREIARARSLSPIGLPPEFQAPLAGAPAGASTTASRD